MYGLSLPMVLTRVCGCGWEVEGGGLQHIMLRAVCTLFVYHAHPY